MDPSEVPEGLVLENLPNLDDKILPTAAQAAPGLVTTTLAPPPPTVAQVANPAMQLPFIQINGGNAPRSGHNLIFFQFAFLRKSLFSP